MKVNKNGYVQMPDECFMELRKAFKTSCCDCNLVHEWKFTKRKGVLGFMINRDNRATAQLRRNK